MRHRSLPLIFALAAGLGAADAPASPTLSWRGSLWASAAQSGTTTQDGSLFLRPMDAGNGQMSLDGLQLGVDVALGQGWTFKTTLLGGRMGRLVNETSGDTGPVALPEAQLVWTGGADTIRFGRMNTFLGMESADRSQDLTATPGLLFSFMDPFTQVGLAWRHAFSPSWSADLWVYNGEDRVKDNNQGKTLGLGLNYNHGGATDRFASLGVTSGPEQTSTGPLDGREPGAEGRPRRRVFFNGQWVWGAWTLQWEGVHGREAFRATRLGRPAGTPDVSAIWYGGGLIARWQFQQAWSAFARVEAIRDEAGVRLAADTTVATLLPAGQSGVAGLGLRAQGLALGVERTWGKTFGRLEARHDQVNQSLPGDGDRPFRTATSLSWVLGTSF